MLVLLFSESKCNASGLYAEYPLLTEPELNSNRRGCIPSSLAMNDGVGISPSSRLFKYLIPVIFFLPPSQPLINVSYFLHLITIGNFTIFLLKITALPIQNLSGQNSNSNYHAPNFSHQQLSLPPTRLPPFINNQTTGTI